MTRDNPARDRMATIERWFPLLLVAAGILAFSNTFSSPFVFDDTKMITLNSDVRHLWPVRLTARVAVDMTFKLNHAVGGFNVADYHAVNLAIHVLAGLLLYGIVRRTLQRPPLTERYGRWGSWVALVAAALWTVHPLQTESVTYICQRYESLMGLFFLLTLYAFIRSVDSTAPRAWSDTAVGACLLGMASKEVMVTAPVLVLLYDYLLVSRSWRRLLRSRWAVHAALMATWGVLIMLRLSSSIASIEKGGQILSGVSPWRYLFTQFGVILHYLRLSVIPHPLCLDYYWPVAEGLTAMALPGVLVASLGVVSLWAVCRQKPSGYLGAWFFLILAPTSSILPVSDLCVEHRMYLPLAAVTVLASIALFHVARPGPWGRPAWKAPVLLVMLPVLLVALLTWMTRCRNLDYRSDVTLWEDVVKKRPDNARAYLGLGAARLLRGEYEMAEDACARMISLLPDFSAVRVEELPRPPRTVEEGDLLYTVNLYSYAQNSIGVSKFYRGDVIGAKRHYAEALRLTPAMPAARENLALALYQEGKIDEALTAWREVLAMDPGNAKAWQHLGTLHSEKGMYGQAVHDYRRALDIEPDLAFVQFHLAWLLATCKDPLLRNGVEAVRLAKEACVATGGQSVRAFDALAAAYAETGCFPDAVRAIEIAMDLARAAQGAGHGQTPDPVAQTDTASVGSDLPDPLLGDITLQALQGRLDLYRAGQPFHYYE